MIHLIGFNVRIGDDNVDDRKERRLLVTRFLLKTRDVRKLVVEFDVNVGSFEVQALESISTDPNSVDTVRVDEQPSLAGQHVCRPNVVDLDCYVGLIHVVDLYHVRIMPAHFLIAAVLRNQFGSFVTIRKLERRLGRDGG